MGIFGVGDCSRSLFLGWLHLLVSSSALADTLVDASASAQGRADVNTETTDASASKATSPTTDYHGQRQIDWIREKGGYIHPLFEIRREDPDDPSSRVATFAAGDIVEGELLFRVPRSCLILSDNDDMCETVDRLVEEMQLGNASDFEPYVSYLKTQPYGQLPTMWSSAGKTLLNDMLQHGTLPPDHVTDVHWGCYDEDDSLEEQHASMLLVQRGWDEVLIPIYDLLSHRNGDHWLGARLAPGASVHDPEEDVAAYARRNIYKGEEIYNTYDQCEDCGARSNDYGTPHILRDYAFVEQVPQKWIFPAQSVSFTLDYEYHDNGMVNADKDLQLIWHSPPPSKQSLHFFELQITRLQEFQQTHLTAKSDDVPSQEWDLIVEYHGALLNALTRVVAQGSERTQESEAPKPVQIPKSWDHGRRLTEWVRSLGGYVNDKMEIRIKHGDESDLKAAVWGVFATQDIDKKEVIMTLPRNRQGDSVVMQTYNDDTCETTRLLAQELENGEHSSYEPFITYLLETQNYGQLPALWSKQGKELMLRMVVEKLEDRGGKYFQILPPKGLVDAQETIGCARFDGTDSHYTLMAAMLVHQRGWDEVLLPIFDMLNHRNGVWHNVIESYSVHDWNKPVQVEASRDIKAGEEIYNSYDNCMDCGARKLTYGTPQILRDYGFVESYPQKWIFQAPRSKKAVVFQLDYFYDDKGRPIEDDDELEVKFLSKDGIDESLYDFMEAEVDRLVEFEEEHLEDNDTNVPQHEWDGVVAYHSALLTALRAGIAKVESEDACLSPDAGGTSGSTCKVSDQGRYDMLDKMYDEENYNSYVCDVDWTFPDHDAMSTIQSKYQKLYFIKHPENQDVCFELDSTWQICGSYRPHYHEMATHYAAAFLPPNSIRRVLWVGGGDSMLLHEILKYPSLELAIGLELDQTVTRASFQQFGTQPHWDLHDKVQWWYGDAAKSLLMLPKEYYGTFDLILVDLSETVMSMTVTKGLDIMGALSLLLRPESVFVKNEIYHTQLSKIFTYASHLHVFDVPVLCSQSFIFGSHTIDFLNQNLTNHGIKDNLFFKSPADEMDYRYFEVHDYTKTPAPPKRACKDEPEEEEPTVQDASPGIVMILEAENASVEFLQSTDSILNTIVPTLEKLGLTVVSKFSSSKSDAGEEELMATVVLKEGYVIARAWAEHKYCAFDIHLWGSFFILEDVKKSLLAAAGSDHTTSSAFRIVAGGMFGVDTWKKDSTSRGPRFEPCPALEQETRQAEMDDESVNIVVEESLGLLLEDDVVAAVICGPKEGGKPCNSIDAVSGHKSVGKVVPLWTCSDIAGGVEYQQGSGSRKFACEREMSNALKNLDGKQVGVVVLDPTAEYAMAQILHKILSHPKNKRLYFSNKLLVLAPMVNQSEKWRRVFLDKFREIFDNEPVFRSEVLFNNSDSSMEMGTFLSDDDHYIGNVQELTKKIEARSGLVGEARNFESGDFPSVLDDPTLFALPGDYDQSGPYSQWKSQQPLGQQNVIQFGIKTSRKAETISLSGEVVKSLLEKALAAADIELTNKEGREFGDLGDGLVVFNVWDGGSIVVLWDGQTNITINIYLYQENKDFAKKFSDAFSKAAKPSLKLELVLQDEMPRGYGRVVNFARDLEARDGEEGDKPHWAVGV